MKRQCAPNLFRSAILICGLITFAAATASAQHPAIYLVDHNGDSSTRSTARTPRPPSRSSRPAGCATTTTSLPRATTSRWAGTRVSDDFGVEEGRPWSLSNGFLGRWYPYAYRQLAKKTNTHADEIDLTVYDFVGFSSPGRGEPPCGACHPGGGGFEFDRDGNRYDEHLAENPELAEIARRRLLQERVGHERRGRGRLPDLPPRGLRLRGTGRPAQERQLPLGGGGRLPPRHRRRRGQAGRRADGHLRAAALQRRRDHHPRHVVAAAGRQLHVLPRLL